MDLALKQMYVRFPEFRSVKLNVAELWKRMQENPRLKSIGVLSHLLPVQLALGVRWHDSTVVRARTYEYRVSRIAADGSVVDVFTTPPVTFPEPIRISHLRLHSQFSDAASVAVSWHTVDGSPPAAFRMYRRAGITDSFSPLESNTNDTCCNVTSNLFTRNDSVICSIVDRSIRSGMVYQYYLVPADIFRNEGQPSDTITVLTFNMVHVPLPEHMSIRSVDSAGLLLRWSLRDTVSVHGIVVERGPQQDSGFVSLFTAGPQDSTFLDATVKPMNRYYYRLRLVGPGGVLSPSSAVIIGTYKSSNEPAPPLGVTATAIKHGVQVSWLGENTQDVEGYYVYRGNGIGDPLFPITPLLPPTSTYYIDTGNGLRGAMRIPMQYNVSARVISQAASPIQRQPFPTSRSLYHHRSVCEQSWKVIISTSCGMCRGTVMPVWLDFAYSVAIPVPICGSHYPIRSFLLGKTSSKTHMPNQVGGITMPCEHTRSPATAVL